MGKGDVALAKAWAAAGGTSDIALALIDQSLNAPDGVPGKLILMAENRLALAKRVERFEADSGFPSSSLAQRLRQPPPPGKVWMFTAKSRPGDGPELELGTMDTLTVKPETLH